MPEMNLAQRKEKGNVGWRRWFGKGFFFLVGITVLTVALWGGLSLYERSLTSQITAKSAQLESVRSDMPQDTINRVADFQFRIDAIAANLKRREASGSPADFLGVIENVVAPGVKLTSYSYDTRKGTIEIDGESDSFRAVVQQMVALKAVPGYETLTASNIGRNESNRVAFSFSVVRAQQ